MKAPTRRSRNFFDLLWGSISAGPFVRDLVGLPKILEKRAMACLPFDTQEQSTKRQAGHADYMHDIAAGMVSFF